MSLRCTARVSFGPYSVLIINNIDAMAHLITVIKKFADDTKLGQVIKSQADNESCLDRWLTGQTMLGMAFHVNKCKMMHISAQNPVYKYTIGGARLGTIKEERAVLNQEHSAARQRAQQRQY